jgi:hypothetical protein
MVASLWPFLLPYSSNVGLYAFSEVRLQHGAPVGLYSRILQGAAVVVSLCRLLSAATPLLYSGGDSSLLSHSNLRSGMISLRLGSSCGAGEYEDQGKGA